MAGVVVVGGRVSVWIGKSLQVTRRRVGITQRLAADRSTDLRDPVEAIAREGNRLSIARMNTGRVDSEGIAISVSCRDESEDCIENKDAAVVSGELETRRVVIAGRTRQISSEVIAEAGVARSTCQPKPKSPTRLSMLS